MLSFAAGAAIAVVPPVHGGKIVSWDTPPDEAVTFKLADGFCGILQKRSDGLHRIKGMTILFL